MKMKIFLTASIFVIAAGILAACGSGSQPTADKPIQGKVIGTAPIGNFTATLSSETGKLKTGDQEVFLAFTDASGKPAAVTAASLNFHMPAMGSMAAMNDSATLSTTSTPGVFKGKVKIQMPGEWIAQIGYEGGGSSGKATITTTAN